MSPPRGRAAVGAALVAAAVGCAAPGPGRAREGAGVEARAPLVGSPGPAIERPVVAGDGRGAQLDWSSLRGHVTVVDFWATWCWPCRQSMPYLQALADRDPAALRVVGVSEDDTEASIPEFARRYAVRFPLVWDDDRGIAQAYRVTGLPTTVVLDPDGVVREMRAGFRSSDAGKLEARIRELGALETVVPE